MKQVIMSVEKLDFFGRGREGFLPFEHLAQRNAAQPQLCNLQESLLCI